jgi:DNA-binding HxlR family transcriptional regulator
MQRKSFEKMACPIARSLERVGEWWSMLIMRDALHGMTRFDEFEKSLGIAPNMLTRRLNALVEAGLLERRRYSQHPPRDEYVPTARGRDFRPVLFSLVAWGNKHFTPEGRSVILVNRKTGAAVDPIIADPATGGPVDEPDYTLAAGPAAGPRTRQRYGAIGDAPSSARERATANLELTGKSAARTRTKK